ncbi:hypothetical protein ASC72_17155 [Flavobacterium sp. Root420]|nr:hypothetical protein ASC72_17155 [Flavobacterium sp. Root420]
MAFNHTGDAEAQNFVSRRICLNLQNLRETIILLIFQFPDDRLLSHDHRKFEIKQNNLTKNGYSKI